jgi:cyanate permease
MGIGGGIFLVAVGAILTFALRTNVSWLDLHVVGWVLMLAGLAVLVLTIWFWQGRRRQRGLTLTEQTQIMHDPAQMHPVVPQPPDTDFPPAPQH